MVMAAALGIPTGTASRALSLLPVWNRYRCHAIMPGVNRTVRLKRIPAAIGGGRTLMPAC